MLLYLSYWLHRNSNIKQWNSFIKGKTEKAISNGKMISFAVLSFLAILREGMETAIFLIGMVNRMPVEKFLMGIVVGVGILVIFGILEAVDKKNIETIQKFGEKLNGQWLSSENKIRESYPLLYTEIEKYLLPLFTEATSENPDQNKLKELAGPLDKSLTKLLNAKESEKKSSAALNKAVQQYKQYVIEETTKLVSATQSFTDAVKAKDVQKAKALYIESRTILNALSQLLKALGNLTLR
jgi:hypothetical protein